MSRKSAPIRVVQGRDECYQPATPAISMSMMAGPLSRTMRRQDRSGGHMMSFVRALEARDVRVVASLEPHPAVEAIAAHDRILVRGSELDHPAGHPRIWQLLADRLRQQ